MGGGGGGARDVRMSPASRAQGWWAWRLPSQHLCHLPPFVQQPEALPILVTNRSGPVWIKNYCGAPAAGPHVALGVTKMLSD